METVEVAALPVALRNPLLYLQQVKMCGQFTPAPKRCVTPGAGDAMSLAPAWIMPTMVVVTSPRGARDVMGRPDAFLDKTLPFHEELRRVMGSNLFDLAHDAWLPRRPALQPVFTKQHFAAFAAIWARPPNAFPRLARRRRSDLDIECRRSPCGVGPLSAGLQTSMSAPTPWRRRWLPW